MLLQTLTLGALTAPPTGKTDDPSVFGFTFVVTQRRVTRGTVAIALFAVEVGRTGESIGEGETHRRHSV